MEKLLKKIKHLELENTLLTEAIHFQKFKLKRSPPLEQQSMTEKLESLELQFQNNESKLTELKLKLKLKK